MGLCCHLLPLLATLLLAVTAQPATRCVVDIALVIDMSGSIMDIDPQANNWKTQMDFVKSLIRNLNVGIDMTRFGAVTFGNRAKLHFTLNQYATAEEYLGAVDLIDYGGGNTNTTGGLLVARDQIFTVASGDRPEIMDLIILLTDGNPTRAVAELPAVAESIRQRGIRIIGIGVTKAVNETVFKNLVTQPFNENYFNVTNFGGLMTILDAIIFASCRTMPPTKPPTTTLPPTAACLSLVDLVIVIDTSGSISTTSFDLIRTFVRSLINDLDVENGRARVGLVIFSDNSKTVFELSKHKSRKDMIQEVNDVIHDRGRTNTASAIRLVRNEIFRTDRGDRPEAANVMLIITDGASNNKQLTLEEAFETKKAGLHTVVVAVGNWLDMEELTNMASYPYEKNSFIVENANALSGIKDGLRDIICNNINECLSNPCGNGGTCVDGIDMYICLCPSSFSGANCERRCPMATDIVFALDASGSVGPSNFQKQVDFVKSLLVGMNLNVDSKVAVLTFSNNPKIKFYMDSFKNEVDLMNALSIYFDGGTTNTAAALATTRQEMFSSSRGERPDKPNIAIILTDGRSNNEQNTWNEAMKTRDAGIHLIAVGIGRNYRIRELEGIASYPVSRNTFEVDSFDTLRDSRESILRSICNDINECDTNPCRNGATCFDLIGGYRCQCLEGFSGTECERGCDGALDIIFAIDTSGSIRNERFPYVRNFVHNIVDNLEVSDTRTRIGVLKWSDQSLVEFHLNQYKTKQDVLQHIRHISFIGGRTHTSSALRQAKDTMFSSQNGDRDNVQNILVVITDGNSNINADRTIPDAVDARVKGIHIIVVSVGSSVNELELRGIASAPEEAHVFLAQTYQDLVGLSSKIVSATCNDRNECESSPCLNRGTCLDTFNRFVCLCAPDWTGPTCSRECRRQMDVVFVLDISGSTETLFDLSLRLTKEIIDGLPIRFSRTRIGIVTYADTAKVEFNLDSYSTKEEILNAVAFRATGGKTNTQEGIARAIDEVFSSGRGDRNGVPNIMIIITDGRSNIQAQSTIPQAERAMDRDIEMFIVGAGESQDVDMAEVNGMASDPDSEHVFRARNAQEVDSTASAILDQLCQN